MKRTSHGSCVVCPYCGYEHGDAWECCNQDYPKEFRCDGCERDFECWAEYDVLYHAREIPAPTLRGKLSDNADD